MVKCPFRTLLVVGDNHEELVKKYSEETVCEKHLKYRFSDAAKLRKNKLDLIKAIMDNKEIKMPDSYYQTYKQMYQDTIELDDIDFYYDITYGCEYDPETNDAYTTENTDAKFAQAFCYDKSFKNTGEEAPMSNPFILKDGSKAYSAHFDEIDWSKMHMNNTKVYESAWEVCVDKRKPKTDIEKQIFENMGNREVYFANFKDKQEYVTHSCAFWTYGYLDNNGYVELDYKTDDKVWVKNFYKNFIEPIKNNPLLTLYEMRSLKD